MLNVLLIWPAFVFSIQTLSHQLDFTISKVNIYSHFCSDWSYALGLPEVRKSKMCQDLCGKQPKEQSGYIIQTKLPCDKRNKKCFSDSKLNKSGQSVCKAWLTHWNWSLPKYEHRESLRSVQVYLNLRPATIKNYHHDFFSRNFCINKRVITLNRTKPWQ